VSIKEQVFNFDKDVSSIDFHLRHISFKVVSKRDVKCALGRGCLKSSQNVSDEVLNMQNDDYALNFKEISHINITFNQNYDLCLQKRSRT
jgi:hypothetical protein